MTKRWGVFFFSNRPCDARWLLAVWAYSFPFYGFHKRFILAALNKPCVCVWTIPWRKQNWNQNVVTYCSVNERWYKFGSCHTTILLASIPQPSSLAWFAQKSKYEMQVCVSSAALHYLILVCTIIYSGISWTVDPRCGVLVFHIYTHSFFAAMAAIFYYIAMLQILYWNIVMNRIQV